METLRDKKYVPVEKTAGGNKRIQVNGALQDPRETDNDQVANIIKFNETSLYNWPMVYNFCRLAAVLQVFRLNTSKTCGEKSSSIFIILDEMKNLTTLAKSTKLKHIENTKGSLEWR